MILMQHFKESLPIMFRFLSKYGQLRRNSFILTQRLAGAAPARKHFYVALRKDSQKEKHFASWKQIRRAPYFNERLTELKIRLKKGIEDTYEVMKKYMSGVVCSSREGSLKKNKDNSTHVSWSALIYKKREV